MAVAGSVEGWKRGGVFRGPGIPAPSGRHAVGSVDLMHKFPEEEDGLLVRLYYPTDAGADSCFEYIKWTSHRRYLKGYLEYSENKAPGFFSAVTNLFLSPKSPALHGAPLLGSCDQPAAPPREPPLQSSAADVVASNGDVPPGTEQDESISPPSKEEAAAVSTDKEGGEGEEEVNPEVNQVAGVGAESDQQQPRPTAFPVVVFSHGLGAMRTTYSAICSDIASHGYIVASVEHRDRSACVTLRRVPRPGRVGAGLQDDWLEFYRRPQSEPEFPLRNEQVKQRASEVGKSLELLGLLNEGADVQNMMDVKFDFGQFCGRLDLSTAAVMGHSFGGSTTIQTLLTDQRFKCGIALDCWMLPIHKDVYDSGIAKPLLFINSFDFQTKENIEKMLRLVKEPNESGVSTCPMLTLRDSNHMNQSDLFFVIPTFVAKKDISRLDPTLAHTVNMELCHSFLGRFLLNDPACQQAIPNLDGGEGHSDVIMFETNVDLSAAPEEEAEEEQSMECRLSQNSFRKPQLPRGPIFINIDWQINRSL